MYDLHQLRTRNNTEERKKKYVERPHNLGLFFFLIQM